MGERNTTHTETVHRVLVFSATAGYRHECIPAGQAVMRMLGEANDFAVELSEDPAVFNDATLAGVNAVVWLNNTGAVLDASERAAFERYIGRGGGFVGVHAAADAHKPGSEAPWPWYGRLLGGGAWFTQHPRGEKQLQTARLHNEAPQHPSTRHFPATWERSDEWYSYAANPRQAGATVLLRLEEATYDLDEAPAMGADHPIAWCHAFGGGRAWYTGLGHLPEHFEDEAYRQHLLGGILWVAGTED